MLRTLSLWLLRPAVQTELRSTLVATQWWGPHRTQLFWRWRSSTASSVFRVSRSASTFCFTSTEARWVHFALRPQKRDEYILLYVHRSEMSTFCFTSTEARWLIRDGDRHLFPQGAGIAAQWLEHRTRDWKVAGSNPCWNGGRIFFSRVDFLCWLLFRYPFHPRVTTVARKKSRPFCQKCRWQFTAKHAYTLRMWILLNRASALVTTCP